MIPTKDLLNLQYAGLGLSIASFILSAIYLSLASYEKLSKLRAEHITPFFWAVLALMIRQIGVGLNNISHIWPTVPTTIYFALTFQVIAERFYIMYLAAICHNLVQGLKEVKSKTIRILFCLSLAMTLIDNLVLFCLDRDYLPAGQNVSLGFRIYDYYFWYLFGFFYIIIVYFVTMVKAKKMNYELKQHFQFLIIGIVPLYIGFVAEILLLIGSWLSKFNDYETNASSLLVASGVFINSLPSIFQVCMLFLMCSKKKPKPISRIKFLRPYSNYSHI